ncbi:Methionyl-tRNA synthetase [Cystobacter fuscus DSM 2262]|uniref:Methionine--tRNA ligase n=1 Tax=Cystobacter fuscus (strain ATCC 25194 / DSM 2262 / NBRC 100088 / M29) TaxID=1242864 RepID=S9PJQ2_CYSF2|nr:methionine--tRNA ligase [Cystobacter fuscus]EPX63296.1 Methionyl-tRNA synthetase [Cystobacter fuscus DSM 2262]
MAQRILVTSALPYANGPIHIGHLVEYVQTDIYVRFLRSCGKDVVYFCADDTHGTPIEINAAKQGLKPEEFIGRWYDAHQADFRDFGVSVDYFHSTNSPENKHYAELIYGRLKDHGDIEKRDIEQAYCETDKRFLPDRFIKGTCPNCKATEQYGDACEKCGKAYAPTDLIDPKCALCGTPPVRRNSSHLFFKLSRHADFLQQTLRREGFINPGLATQLQGFFEKGLADWDISRDGPYFGFNIPGETDKYFYVWLDAPIGYIATTEKWAKSTGKAQSALDFWSEDSDTRIIHFIGKDIVYFHALFWPAVLKVAGLKRPDAIKAHGHLTVNGEKMSKSRGTLIPARSYLEHLDPSYLRYFYAANLGPGVEDLDLSLKDFRLRVNGELVNNIGNLANRSLSMLAGAALDKRLAPATKEGPGRALVEAALARVPEVREAYEKLEYRNAIRVITEISQSANGFLQTAAPWVKVKTDPEAARADLSDAAEVAYLLGALLTPVIPRVAEKLFAQLNAPPLTFEVLATARYPLLDRARPVGTPEPLMPRLEEERVNAILGGAPAPAEPAPETKKGGKAEKKAAEPKPAEVKAPEAKPAEVAPGEIDITDFAKVVLKVGHILAAERVPKADKLLKLTVDLGEGQPRTICSGIAEAFQPEQVQGRKVVVVANLKPRMLRGIESRGMILTAGSGGKDLSLLDPGDMPPGSEVK